MRRDMVADEFRCVSFDLATACHLASEQITLECLNAQTLPSDQLIPLAPWLCCLTMLVAILFITRCRTQARWQRAERRLECGKSGHTYNAKRRPSGRLVVRRRIAVALTLNRRLAVETVRVGAYRRTHLETFVSLASGQNAVRSKARNQDHRLIRGMICTHTFSICATSNSRGVGRPKILTSTSTRPFPPSIATTMPGKLAKGPSITLTALPTS